jgi:hypothetical protein
MSGVTAARPGAYAPDNNRNGHQNPSSEAVTNTRPGAYDAGQRAVTCRRCNTEIPPDKAMVVHRGHNYSASIRSGDPLCIPCVKADRYLIPWFRSGRPRSDYEHWCLRCRRFFYGGVRRRYCSDECGELERRSRRDRCVDRVQHRCECGVTFTARADAQYCSNACRQRAYRQRGSQP